MTLLDKYYRFEETVEPRYRAHMERLRLAGQFDRVCRAVIRCTRVGEMRNTRRYDDYPRNGRLPAHPL